MGTTRRHAFLSPAFNAWSIWTAEGTEAVTNPGASHRELESLAYAIDQMADKGWDVQEIYVENGRPTLVLLVRDGEASVDPGP